MQSTDNKYYEYIRAHGEVRPSALVRGLKISKTALHIHLRRLIKNGLIEKLGTPPKIIYKVKSQEKVALPTLSSDLEEFLEKNYLYISPKGELLTGVAGFYEWVVKTKQESQFENSVRDYVKTRLEANKFIGKNGLIDATSKLEKVFVDVYLEAVYYKDFYSLSRFGKTRLGQLVLYAKQSQNQYLMLKICDEIKKDINNLIIANKISAVGYIPPTVPRKIQFINELKNMLDLPFPEVPLMKIQTKVVVPQKTLSVLSERVTNAQQTIIPLQLVSKIFGNILLIDDAIGSGATLNETASKIRKLGIVKGKIIGFAIVGSYKGFDVIREV